MGCLIAKKKRSYTHVWSSLCFKLSDKNDATRWGRLLRLAKKQQLIKGGEIFQKLLQQHRQVSSLTKVTVQGWIRRVKELISLRH